MKKEIRLYKVEENPYQKIYVDLTMKCNMNCNVCYNANINKPDLDINYFHEVCKRLPFPTKIRFLGGEPTVYENLFEAFEITKKFRHIPFMVTNGLKLADFEYCKKVSSLKPFFIAVSFDGGLNRELHEKINNMDCLNIKLKALDNLYKCKHKRIIVCCTILRGINESSISDMFKLVKMYPGMIKYIHFRSQLMSGNYIDKNPYTYDELYELVNIFRNIESPYKMIRDGKGDECCGSCSLFWLEKNLKVAIIASNQIENNYCSYRGYLRDNFIIEPFYWSMRQRNN